MKLALALLLSLAAQARAHEGPPFAILVDEPADGCRLSVWADPDVGTGSFYLMIDPLDGVPAPTAEMFSRIEVWVQPVSGRLPAVSVPATRQAELTRLQFLAEPIFDREERWNAGIVLVSRGHPPREWVIPVDVTPPGGGPGFILVYLLPFVIFGGLWGKALLRTWSRRPLAERRER